MSSEASSIVAAVLRAAEPGPLVRRALEALRNEGRLEPPPGRVLAVGKAARPMALAALDVLGAGVPTLVVSTPSGGAPERPGVELIEADHPVPTARNVGAARSAMAFVRAVPEDGRLLFLLSGGASALLCLPRPPLELEHLAALTEDLLAGGAAIGEINAVRKHSELAKGGNLARACPGRITALVLADVLPEPGSSAPPVHAVGSGPTAPDPTTFGEALAVVRRLGSAARHPEVVTLLERGAAGEEPETPKPGDPVFDRVEHRVIGSNRLVVDAACIAAEGLGYALVSRLEGVEGEAAEVGRALAQRALEAAGAGARSAIVWGGETTVTLGPRHGLGGRNQELALAGALAIDEAARAGDGAAARVTVLTLATDGRDGPTDAAGAIVDAGTCELMRASGVDPVAALAGHDAHRALDRAGALVRPGPTGTNLNDVAVALVEGAGG